MKIYRSVQHLPSQAQGAVVALGNFDGVHLGHQKLLVEAQGKSKQLKAPLAVLTFEPHPRSFFTPEVSAFRLTSLAVKARLLAEEGVELLYILKFNQDLSQLSAQDFIARILLQQLKARHIVVGEGFVFGSQRSGDVALLRHFSQKLGYGLTVMPPVMDSQDLVISSTRIRESLKMGRIKEAAALLGHSWSILGRIQRGQQRGRTIGIPTANVTLKASLRPAFGVYVVQARTMEGEVFQGIANIGVRPTVGGTQELLEVHLFDVQRDLYGQKICVSLLQFLRPEKKFSGLESLLEQIKIDIQQAREFLAREGEKRL